MHPSCSEDYAGDFIGIHTAALALELGGSLNLPDLSEELALSRNDSFLTTSAGNSSKLSGT